MRSSSNIYIFKWKTGAPAYARLTPDGNYVIEDLEAFMGANFERVYLETPSVFIANFYKMPKINLSIKANITPAPMGMAIKTRDYEELAYVAVKASLYDDSNKLVAQRAFLYFVTGVDRISSSTLLINLRMDTLNTFAPGLGISPTDSLPIKSLTFDDDTLVVREHRDRFVPLKNALTGKWNGKVRRKIDKVNENFSVPTFPFKRTTIEESDEVLKKAGRAYLIYKSNGDLSPDNLENPLNVYLAYDNGLPVTPAKEGGPTTITVSDINFASNRQVISFWKWQNPNLKHITMGYVGADGTPRIAFDLDLDSALWEKCDLVTISYGGYDLIAGYASLDYLKDGGTTFGLLKAVGSPSFTNPKSITITADDCNYYSLIANSDVTTSLSFHQTLTALKFPDGYTKGNGGTGEIIGASMAQVNRYDPKNVKIIALPYSPIVWKGNASTGYQPPDGWSIVSEEGLLSPAEPDQEMKRNVGYYDIASYVTSSDYPASASKANAKILRNDDFESKQYNSAFHSLSFYYDSFSWQLMGECLSFDNVEVVDDCTLMEVTYYQSSSISSKLGFSFGSGDPTADVFALTNVDGSVIYPKYNPPLNYPQVLICARNLELPIFTSDYLNYIRTGYNYDVKANDRAWRESWVQTAVGFGSAGLTALAGKYAVAGAALAGSIYKTYANIEQGIANDEALERTLREKSNKAIGVMGSDDLDIFEWYSGNKLRVVESEPSETTLKYVLDLFHYFGYATNERKSPAVKTRADFNFLQCDPRFVEEQTIGVEIADDLKAKYNAGVTYLWNNDGEWDFAGKYANLELWAITGNI